MSKSFDDFISGEKQTLIVLVLFFNFSRLSQICMIYYIYYTNLMSYGTFNMTLLDLLHYTDALWP